MLPFVRRMFRALIRCFHSAKVPQNEEWLMVTGDMVQELPWPVTTHRDVSQAPDDFFWARLHGSRSPVYDSPRTLSDASSSRARSVLGSRDDAPAAPSTCPRNNSSASLPPRISVVPVDSDYAPIDSSVVLDPIIYTLPPSIRESLFRPPPLRKERAILRWQPIDETYEQQVVEIYQPDGSSRTISIDGPTRPRATASLKERYAWRVPYHPAPAAAHLNSASFSGSHLPHDQLYQQELDWVTSHPAETTSRRARLLGVFPDKQPTSLGPPSSQSPNSKPSTWSVVQRHELPIDAASSSVDWLSGGILGEGTYSTIYLVYHKPLGRELAMKVTYLKRPLPSYVCEGIENELKALDLLAQQKRPLPYLLQPAVISRKWAWTSSEGFLHIVTPFCPGGDLFDYKGTLSEQSLRRIIAEMVIAIEQLHFLGVVHHDIKPENILVDADGHCVLTDFGGSKFLSETGKIKPHPSGRAVATLPYAAPEILDEVVTEYDESVDWWSLGATILTLLTGQVYFSTEPRAKLRVMMPQHLEHVGVTMEAYGCPSELIDLVEQLLQIDPAMRPKGPVIRGHCYFSNLPYTWEDVARRSPGVAPLSVIHPVAALRQGAKSTCKDWPSEFDANDPDQCYLPTELRKAGVILPDDDDCDVLLMHHQTVHA